MAYGVTPQGFVKKTLSAVRDAILDYWRANISATIDTSEDGLEYQLASSFAEQIAEAWDAQEAEYASRDPAQAEGQALDDLLHLRGIYRRPATQSLVTATVTLEAGTYAAGDLVATVAGDPTARFANDAEVVSLGVYDANKGGTGIGGTDNVVFRAESDGPVHANAGTLTVQATTPSGWSEITNAGDAILGLNEESDTDYYNRSEEELGAEGSTTADAIRAALLQLDDVRYARVYVNDDPDTDANGVLGNSVEAVMLGGDDAEIRKTLLDTKAGGIRARGSDSGTIADSQGNVYEVGFTRPTQIQPYITVNISYNPDLYPGDAAVKQYLLDWGDANLSVGLDVVHNKLVQLVMALPGVYDCTIAMGSTPSPVNTTDNFVILVRQYADLDSTRVNVVGTPATGPA